VGEAVEGQCAGRAQQGEAAALCPLAEFWLVVRADLDRIKDDFQVTSVISCQWISLFLISPGYFKSAELNQLLEVGPPLRQCCAVVEKESLFRQMLLTSSVPLDLGRVFPVNARRALALPLRLDCSVGVALNVKLLMLEGSVPRRRGQEATIQGPTNTSAEGHAGAWPQRDPVHVALTVERDQFLSKR
jgi:hypothetical protein